MNKLLLIDDEADVQYWLDHPQSNFGWMLICQTESENFTARRFGSRENTNKSPFLTIQFIPPLRIDAAQRTNDDFRILFTAAPGLTYTVEFQDSLAGGPWSPLTNFPPASIATNRIAADLIAQPRRFYRLMVR